MGRVVLVTGAARRLGGRFVRRTVRDPEVDRVIAVDTAEPSAPLGGAEFVRTDIRQPSIGTLLAEYGVDTVVHTDVHGTPHPGRGGLAAVKETNVIGTMQLLAACQRASRVARLVVTSSTSVYGSAPRSPASFDESDPPRAAPGGGFARDVTEVEGYVRGFARRRPDVPVTVLRFAPLLGARPDSEIARYLALPVLPTVLGYDPRLQFLHEDDALRVLAAASAGPAPGTYGEGTFNIAGDGVLLLSQCARRLGRPMFPLLPAALRWSGSLLRSAGLADLSGEQIRLLTHGRVVSTSRMREVLGFHPRYTSAQALAAFARGVPAGPLPPEGVARVIDRIAALVPAGGVASSSRNTALPREAEEYRADA